MPLEPGRSRDTISHNISELTHHGSRPRSHKQIVAIALANADRHPKGFAFGGAIDPWAAHQQARAVEYQNEHFHPGGFIASDTAGRTDRLPMSVAAESHIIPADVVSGLGQGNSLNGARVLDAMFNSAPYGAALPHGHRGSGPPHRRADGGNTGVSRVLLAGGEYSVPPETVASIGARARSTGKSKARTDAAAGHQVLDEMIGVVRKETLHFLKHAPAPKK